MKQQKKKKGRSVQDLLGIKTFTKYGLSTNKGELLFYLVSPTNISVLSHTNIEIKIRHLMMVLSALPDIEIVCTDSSECFDDNKAYLTERLKAEENVYLAQKGMKSITVPNWYDEGKEVTIPLDLRFSPSQNAQNFFKNYKKKQTAARMLVDLLAEGEKEIAYLETVLYEVETAAGEAALNEIRAELKSQGYLKYYKQRDKRQKPADFLRFTSTDVFFFF